MKNLLFLWLLLLLTVSSVFAQVQTNRQVLSRKNLNDATYRFGYRTAQKKCIICEEPKYGYDLTTDTLVALLTDKLQANLILTPDGKIIVKPAQRIELYKNFYSESEVATNYTWKGKIIYTQKFLIDWYSDNIILVSGVDYLYYFKHVDVATNNVTGVEERNVSVIGPTIEFNPITHTIKAYRPPLVNGRYAQQAEIVIQYTKQ